MILDDEQLLTFKTVAELQNYSKAAALLNVTQPAVTARIQKLETELDCKLFFRDGNRILLTKEGGVLLTFSEKILSFINEAKRTVSLLKVPELKIGLSPAFSTSVLLQIMSLIQTEHQNLSFNIVEGEDSLEILNKVSNDQIDIGLIRNIIPYANVETKFICKDQLVFIVGQEHPLANKTEIKKSDLIGQTMICYRRHTPLWLKIDEKLYGVQDLNRIEVGGFEMVTSMVGQKWGFSIIPKLAVGYEDQRFAERNLCIIPFPELETLSLNVIGIYKKDSPKMENLNLFLRFFEQALNR